MRERWSHEEESNLWPAIADAFIGFLAFVLIAGLAAYTQGQDPPIAKQDFRQEFEKAFRSSMNLKIEPGERPKVADEGFSELNIYFPAAFLFEPCHADLMTPAKDELTALKSLLKKFDPQIQRVQITGHTDTDRPHPGGECYHQGMRTNWELSARRAITVVELLAPDDGSGLNPRKVWAAALSEYHPVIDRSDSDAKSRNRRIEVLVRFRER
jgi:flagellar motor protein MotB